MRPRSPQQLRRQYARFKARLTVAEEKVAAIRSAMMELEAEFVRLRPASDLSGVPPLISEKRSSPIKTGGWAQGTLDILRVAELPMDCFEIADLILRRHAIDPDAEPYWRDVGVMQVRQALKYRQDRLVQSHGGRPERWSIKR